MSDEVTIRAATPSDAAAIAELHADSISWGFLVALGQPFLERLYRRVTSGNGAFGFVGLDGGDHVSGFVAVAEDTRRLYREFVVHDGVVAGARAAPALLRHPWQVLETLRYGLGADDAPAGAEILATAVAGSSQGKGVGVALVEAAMDEFRRRGIEHVHVGDRGRTTTPRNAPTTRCGFRHHCVRRSAPRRDAGTARVALIVAFVVAVVATPGSRRGWPGVSTSSTTRDRLKVHDAAGAVSRGAWRCSPASPARSHGPGRSCSCPSGWPRCSASPTTWPICSRLRLGVRVAIGVVVAVDGGPALAAGADRRGDRTRADQRGEPARRPRRSRLRHRARVRGRVRGVLAGDFRVLGRRRSRRRSPGSSCGTGRRRASTSATPAAT